ncbi:MAG: hypothetical protein P0Y60_12355 [Candidatus Microbacterium colombiense]|nr:MAG: hypothetical protein P0Y60_12355 [Microbacterium sp.]
MIEESPIHGAGAPSEGGHTVPLRFSENPPLPTPPRRRRTGLLLGITGAVLLIAAAGTVQVTANAGYDTAEQDFRAAARSTAETRTEVDDARNLLEGTTDSAALILDGDTGALVDPAAKEAVAEAASTATEALASADSLLAERVPAVGEKPIWFWELLGATGSLEQDRRDVDALEERLGEATGEISVATDSLTDAGITLLTTTADSATAFEAAHLSAKNDAVIALRDSAVAAAGTTAIDEDAVTAFTALQTAAAQLVASEKSELAEKSGPLLNARLEIEAFARKLAPGVLLDFDWAPIVNGVGYDGSMGGYTTWWWDDPGRATIELSNSVAEQWPADRSKALVAHEVGHAISVKCADMYDSSTQDSIEKWATAWAISMGYTDDANGVWAYGYPPQNYIDAAAGCR